MNDASKTEEIKKRLYQANEAYHSVLPIIKSQATVVIPVDNGGKFFWPDGH